MKKRRISKNTFDFVLISLFILLVCGGFAYRYVIEPRRAAPKLSSEQTETPVPAPLDPLQIEAIRSRTYIASPITTVQNLGSFSGYTSQLVSYISDGLTIYGQQFTPSGTPPAGGWPVIILNHGYFDPADYQTTNTPTYTNLMARLAQAGYVVIKPDYRGHGSSQGTPEGGHFSPVYAYDTLNLIASLKQYPLVNAARIGTLGHSLGAHVSLRTAVSSADVKATAYLSGVVSSIYSILYDWPRSPMPGDRPAVVQSNRENLLAKYGDPKANPTFWDSVSAINFVRYIVGPSLVWSSTADGTVPPVFSQHLVTALQQASKPVDYFTTPGNDHLFSAAQATVVQRVVDFFKANL